MKFGNFKKSYRYLRGAQLPNGAIALLQLAQWNLSYCGICVTVYPWGINVENSVLINSKPTNGWKATLPWCFKAYTRDEKRAWLKREVLQRLESRYSMHELVALHSEIYRWASSP